MDGADMQQAGIFNYVSPQQRVPQDHPLRAVREMVDSGLSERDQPPTGPWNQSLLNSDESAHKLNHTASVQAIWRGKRNNHAG